MRMPPDISPDQFWRISRATYDRMIEAGIFDGERVELVDGTLVEMTPQNDRHAQCVRKLNLLLVRLVEDARGVVQCQGPVALSDDGEPQPDLAILPPGDYPKKPTTALLVIEVSDSSLAYDRGAKARIYATAAIPEYWVVDLVHGRVEIRTSPENGAYRDVRIANRADTVAPTLLPEVQLAVSAFLPEAD